MEVSLGGFSTTYQTSRRSPGVPDSKTLLGFSTKSKIKRLYPEPSPKMGKFVTVVLTIQYVYLEITADRFHGPD